jgi:hypothetical protein
MALDQTSESSDPAIEASTPASHRYGDALMNGVQPAAEMQALRPEVKILLMSAYRTKEIDEYRMQLELRGLFLDKPSRSLRSRGRFGHQTNGGTLSTGSPESIFSVHRGRCTALPF